ncbi:uncharacterized protein [Ptychodera flava]|uniref:uncharacterized protein isoform X2 n=1 Tax=Ptychodera flava TaxID=63121 RepID=UPI00396A3833
MAMVAQIIVTILAMSQVCLVIGQVEFTCKPKVWTLSEQSESQESAKNDWKVVFKAMSGIGGNLYAIYTSNKPMNQDRPEARELNDKFKGHYKSYLMDHWEALGVSEVKIAMFREGVEKVSMVFNGIGSTKMDWFTKERLKSSPWQDLMDSFPQQGINYFSISGHADINRRFFVNNHYDGCPNDFGWMVVVDDGNNVCPWSTVSEKPFFMYSPHSNKVNWDEGQIADVMAIFIKHKFQYIEPQPIAELGWELVFKAVPGVGGSVFNLWNNNGGRNQDNIQARQLNANYRDHYKSPKVDTWSTLGVREVKLSVYEDGEERMYLIFDARGSDKSNWLSNERLISTPYHDLLDADVAKNFFSLSGDAPLSRRFFINSVYPGCANDVGWLVVVDPGHVVCPWSNDGERPYFLYSKTAQRANYNSDSVGRADFMAIHIKTYQQDQDLRD